MTWTRGLLRAGRWGDPRDRVLGWVTAVAVTLLAAVLRLQDLGRPASLVFDETYYVKDAWTLLNLGYEARWPEEPNPAFEAGDVHSYLTEPSYVVHPPVGKWVIALGLRVVGAEDPVGWRLGTALAGVLAVLLLARVTRRLFRSSWAGAAAGLLLAVDNAAIAHSRTALLDGVLMVLVLAAFAALLLDRDLAHTRLRRLTAPPRAPSSSRDGWGPDLGWRPWRLAAGLLLGLAVGTKWSGLWFVAVLGLLTVGWDAAARYRTGQRGWWAATLLRDAPVAFLQVVGGTVVAYLVSWTSWFRSPGAWGRQWATEHPGEGIVWLPEPLRALAEYHRQMWGFHTSLTSDHDYASHPAGWVLQVRPTSFFYESPEPPQQWCGADHCSQTVTSLGNPALWWLAAVAVLACLWWVVRRGDGVAVAALSGVVAGWAPWFLYTERTIYAFYAIVFLPWLVLCLVWTGLRLLRWGESRPDRSSAVRGVVAAAVVVVLAVAVFYYPLATAQVTTFRFWQLHMWLPGWV